MPKGDFGVVGLGVMGQMVALNAERNGFHVIAYNRSDERADEMRANAQGKNVTVTQELQEFVNLLEAPRRILLMVTAGRGTDAVISGLTPLLQEDDVIIDGGNAHFPDTERRHGELAEHGIRFVGCGISGGEQGALWGPSIMPGGKKSAYDRLAPVLEKIAAKTDDDGPCVTYCGASSAGHYVKMVHNGIEYGIMQLICEVYEILRKTQGLTTAQIHDIFESWRDTDIGGFLVDITAECLNKMDDDTDKHLVEVILDTAGQKGTGKWTAQSALDLGVAIPTLSMSVEARILSGAKRERVNASKVLGAQTRTYAGHIEDVTDTLFHALHLGMVACYAQGMALIQAASQEYEYGTNLAEVARIWKAGCIIRSRLLDPIKRAYLDDPELVNLMLAPEFSGVVNNKLGALRVAVELSAASGVAATCLGATLAYIDSYRTEFLPANLLQALRDNFGAHTFKRLDKQGTFHAEWSLHGEGYK